MGRIGSTDSTTAPGNVATLVAPFGWVEGPPGTYSPAASVEEATHLLNDNGGRQYTMEPVEIALNPARQYKRGNTYMVRGAP